MGLLIHRESGAIICQYCQQAIEPKSVFSHLKRNGHFFNNNSPKITKAKFLEKLLDQGGKEGKDMGYYTHPSKEELNSITALPVVDGLVCAICNELDVFYATASELTLNHHFRATHLQTRTENNTFNRKLQTIFGNNRAKYYCIKVGSITQHDMNVCNKF